jgi:hypothetical protein
MGTLSPDGYNLKEGGAGGKLSEETKRRIGDGNKGKIVSKETRQMNREAVLGENNHMWGKKARRVPDMEYHTPKNPYKDGRGDTRRE